ncbi:hypothetical protein G5V59_06745 [Nocardioides sp. W3-2-3]|nr:hypothetical protein [Nocardioides convexus]
MIAALGVALVFIYARHADNRAAAKYDAVEVLTASQEIEPGESLDDALKNGKVQLTHIAKAQAPRGRQRELEAAARQGRAHHDLPRRADSSR